MFSGADGQGGADVMLCPVALTAAFPHDHSEATRPFFTPSARTMQVDEASLPYWYNVFWAGVCNAPGLPSTAFPVRLSSGLAPAPSKPGLPVGLQCIAPQWHDFVSIEMARRVTVALHGTE